MRRSFADFLDDMTIAMEADDITSQVAGELKDAVGGTPSTASDTDTRSNEEDLEKTDDIFDLKKDDDPTKNDESTDTTDDTDNENLDDNTDDTGDENTDDSSDNSDDSEDSLDDTSSEDSSDDIVFTKKNKIRDSIVQLYMIVSGNIESIESSIININDANTIKVLNNVITHLRNCKAYMYNTLTKELKGLEYDELLRRYITIKKVYDLCIEMLETHFKKSSEKSKK